MRSRLYRHADFRRLWAGQTISQFGSQVTNLALPLVAVQPVPDAAAKESFHRAASTAGMAAYLAKARRHAELAVRVIVDDTGARVLTDADAEIFGRVPAGVLDRIINRCTELSGKAEEEIDDLGNGSASQAASGVSS